LESHNPIGECLLQTIATVCMFLAGKVEETPRPLKDVILISYEMIHKKDPAAAQRIKQKMLLLMAFSSVHFDALTSQFLDLSEILLLLLFPPVFLSSSFFLQLLYKIEFVFYSICSKSGLPSNLS
jgi:hypothetical protein